jgi:hypothetical protein
MGLDPGGADTRSVRNGRGWVGGVAERAAAPTTRTSEAGLGRAHGCGHPWCPHRVPGFIQGLGLGKLHFLFSVHATGVAQVLWIMVI